MMTRREINKSPNKRIKNCLKIDEITFQTMRDLNLHCFRSSRDRPRDRQIAIGKYAKKVDLKKFAIHHTMSGLVGLVPIEIHKSLGHDGYFYRLKH